MNQRTDIKLLKTDQGCGIVVMDSNKYHEKLLKHLSTKPFVKHEKDLSNSNDLKV